MRKIVSALLGVIPGMLSIASLLVLFFYIFAIIATHLFGEDFPQWFGDLGDSFYTLFQIMTLESWSMGIARPIMEVHPQAWLFFLVFIFMATFIMINLIVAVVVDAMGDLSKKEKSSELKEIEALRAEVRELKELLKESIKK
jgi:voltage-gated sodium channel